MAALNIKNPKTHALAERLARTTGETLTTAVTRALEERLARVETSETRVEELLAIGRECAARLKAPSFMDHADMLYDERGLPR